MEWEIKDNALYQYGEKVGDIVHQITHKKDKSREYTVYLEEEQKFWLFFFNVKANEELRYYYDRCLHQNRLKGIAKYMKDKGMLNE